MNKKLLLTLILSATAFINTNAFSEGNWIKDQNGCKHWNYSPSKNESITWSGTCTNGYASGYGKLQWYKKNIEENYYLGNKKHGKPDGYGISTFSSGIMEGTFSNGKPENIKITYNKPTGAVKMISVEGNYKTIKREVDGVFFRTYPDGRKEKVIVKNGQLYANNTSAQITQSFTSVIMGKKTEGLSCVDTCREIRKEETQNCKISFSGGNPLDTSNCIKEAHDGYAACKTGC